MIDKLDKYPYYLTFFAGDSKTNDIVNQLRRDMLKMNRRELLEEEAFGSINTNNPMEEECWREGEMRLLITAFANWPTDLQTPTHVAHFVFEVYRQLQTQFEPYFPHASGQTERQYVDQHTVQTLLGNDDPVPVVLRRVSQMLCTMLPEKEMLVASNKKTSSSKHVFEDQTKQIPEPSSD